MMLKYLCILVVLLAVCHADFNLFHKKKSNNRHHENGVLKTLKLMKNDIIDDFHKVSHKLHKKKNVTVNSFNWNNCGSSGDIGSIKSLTVKPDPIHIPGQVTVSFSGSLKQQVSAPVQLSLDIKKKELFWIPVPCIDNLGSCDYSDVCPMLKQVQCPPIFKKYNIPCRCPMKAGNFNLPSSKIDIDTTFGIPSWLEKGDFQVKATMKTGGRRVICVDIDFTLG